ncbi:Phosphatidylinositol transfer protein sfh5 [Wickerhamomyces ciferrii]|uniref:Phosphatidylinositol transfer protein SFH5 n=1 Tax=Wickerhamomyces ciferrii (strain ATCC 14091 / BCRC 22168 / CBS 111 / JCM 3599 / NBRC 0793 / NRRL Y-1031 F-60-10) TaxID=1206466 RepID=K0KSS0_WICCF|nr:Phosphatidylinositol transfer protein sfh5 [Wickerhamomyces ciferrii]CCH44373.1 Phosphatidylinositol transfer protein sfh5 [Wickerhamomyces ciferrii]
MSNVTVKTVHLETDDQKQKFDEFIKQIPDIIKVSQYDELFGHQLSSDGEYFNQDVFHALVYKFLVANEFDLGLTREQLTKTLKWRKEFNPLSAAFNEDHDSKFDDIGILTTYSNNEANTKNITWNLYGAGGNPKELFKDLDKFLRYRVGLMERNVQLLDFTKPENNFATQIHDYKGVSFLKFDPDVKKGSKATIQIFQDYYPELLYKKFFVNVPSLLFWVFEFVKKFLSDTTTRKFIVLNNSENLVKYLGNDVPKIYGGKGDSLKNQNVKEIKPPVYGAHLSQELFTNEVD